jgi:outer membrane protein OmpA-like peptidoglycan-associated protein
MQNKSSEKKSTKKKIIHSARFWFLLGLMVFAVLFFTMLPVGMDYGIERYLKDQGADQVSLADVDFNPITGRVTLTNLAVIIGKRTALQIQEATTIIRWTPFLRKRLVLQQLKISDTKLIVEELENGGWQVGGINIPQQTEAGEQSAWGFSLQEATIDNSRIEFISPRLKSSLAIDNAKISRLTSWMPQRSAQLEFKGQLNGARMQLQTDVTPFGSHILVSGRIKIEGLNLNPLGRLLQPQLKSFQGRLDLDLTVESRQNADGGISHYQKGPVKLYQVQTRIADMNLSQESLAWDGSIRVKTAKPREALKIVADGQLNGSTLKLGIEKADLRVQQDNFSWKGKIDYAQDKTGQKITGDGQISLVDLAATSPQFNLSEKKLTWRGPVEFSTGANPENQRIIADGALSSSHLQLNLHNRKLRSEHRGLTWKGRLDSGETNDFSSLKAEADVVIDGIQILHSETNQHLLDAHRLDLKAAKVESLNQISISGIALNSLALLSGPEAEQSSAADPPPVRIQEIKFNDVRLLQQNNLDIDAIRLNALKAFVQRDAAGKSPAIDKWNAIVGDVFSADQTQRTASDTSTKKKSGTFKFRIGHIEVAGDSRLRFRDESVSPAFSTDLTIREARLSDLDNSRPQQPASVKLLVSDKENARLSLDGTMQPFAEKLSLDWKGKIEALALPPLSPYIIQSTGYRFTGGELQADIPLQINQNQLKGAIDLIMYHPEVKAVDRPKAQKGKIRLGMSLDSALRLLSDKRNDVKLNIPISGNIKDPQFSIADAVNKVLAKALQKSALSYLKYMLGPYGIGISVAQFAYEQASKIRLNPILFAPGSDDLDAAAVDYLKRVAAIMKDYPEVQMSVCGVATESDRKAMNENASTKDAALLDLAKKRTERIKNQLVKLHGIATKRIIACEPEIDSSAAAKPRANLKI